jgi:hypothetical protein
MQKEYRVLNDEINESVTTQQEQLEWHAPQLTCFDASEAESGAQSAGDGTSSHHSS